MTFISSAIHFFKNEVYRNLAISSSFTLTTGTFFYHFAEKWNWIDSFYFSVITLTTVGYGDLYPKTNTGKIFTAFYLLIGIGILFTFINELGSTHHKRIKKKSLSRIARRNLKTK